MTSTLICSTTSSSDSHRIRCSAVERHGIDLSSHCRSPSCPPSSSSSSSSSASRSDQDVVRVARPHLKTEDEREVEHSREGRERQKASPRKRIAVKRAPASWSSNGIETLTGPPPALSTQRSYTVDHGTRSVNLRAENEPSGGGVGTTSASRRPSRAYLVESGRKSVSSLRRGPLEFETHGADRETIMDGAEHHRYASEYSQRDPDRALRALDGTSGGRRDGRGDGEYNGERVDDRPHRLLDPERKHSDKEDLFLNLAKVNLAHDDAGDTSLRTERRRSRIGLNGKRQSLPAEAPSSSVFRLSRQGPDGGDDGMGSSPALAAEERWHDARARRTPQPLQPSQHHHHHQQQQQQPPHLTPRSSAASAHPLDDLGRTRYFGSSSRASLAAGSTVNGPTLPRYGLLGGRRKSTVESKSKSGGTLTQVHPPAPYAYTSSKSYDSSSPLVHRANGPVQQTSARDVHRAEGTDSTASTNAPSTVWDELGDLKSRIRTLELTGRLPPSSGVETSNGLSERPRTATTTMTTMSSSPKRGTGETATAGSTAMDGTVTAGIHPLLHAALTRSKSLLGAEVYRALEGTASDALLLAVMASNVNQTGTMVTGSPSVIGSGSMSERHIRRKADSICRGLTELCIALGDEKATTIKTGAAVKGSPSTARTGSRDSPYNRVLLHRAHGGAREDSSREASLEPESRHVPADRAPSRALVRAEARRTSLLALKASNSNNNSPRGFAAAREPPSPAQGSPTSSFHANRASSITQNKGDDNNTKHVKSKYEPGLTTNIRAPSRAATEINPRHHQHDRSSTAKRNYTPSSIQVRRQRDGSSSSGPSTPNAINTSFTLKSSSSPSTIGLQQPGRHVLDRANTRISYRRPENDMADDGDDDDDDDDDTLTTDNMGVKDRHHIIGQSRRRSKSLSGNNGGGGGGGRRYHRAGDERAEVRFDR